MSRSLVRFSAVDVLAKSRRRPAFFFDFDGTLADLAERPELVELSWSAKSLLEELSRHFLVGVISGRKLSDVKRLVSVRKIFYSGNHGVEITGPRMKFIEPESAKGARTISALTRLIRQTTRPYGVLIQDKKFSVAVHYRTLEPSRVKSLLADVNKLIEKPARSGAIKVLHGKKVIEVKPPVNWDKGKAVRYILDHAGRGEMPMFFGDDLTDEYAFKEVNKLKGISVFVGTEDRKTAAKYRVDTPAELVNSISAALPILTLQGRE